MMTPDQFKSLIFVCSLQSHADADVRTRILHKLEQEPHMTLQDIAAECQRLINLKHDTKMIENAHFRNEPQIYHTAVRGKNVSHRVPNQKPPTSCWNCGGWHFVRFCSYRKHLCQKCKRLGHKESHCHTTYNSRTVSGPKLHTNSKSKKTFNGAKTKVVLATCHTEFAGKRKYLTVEINNVPISLQLDTASDITIISRSSWMRLGRPPLRHTNLTAQNASGEPLRLDGEFTCEVKFKDLKLCGTIYLISSVDINLLGIDWIERLNLFNVPLNHVCSETNVIVHHTTVPSHPRQNIADALSRLIDTSRREPEDAVIASITTDTDISHMIQDAVSTLPLTARMVQAATSRDTLLQKVLTYTRQGWPKQCPDKSLAQFFTRRDALSEVDACLFFADRLVIPEVLRQRVLRQLHKGHPGIARMKALARSYVFWPSMDSQIEDIGRSCSKCCSVSKLPVRTTLQSWPRPESPWSRIHVDFVGPVEGTFFLVIVDAYSKWPEVTVMRNTSSNSTILALKRLFSQYGLPQTIVSDNGSQFTSYQFADFCAQNGIQHMRTAPYHPQSNGQAERYVDTLKRALLKSKGEGTLDERLENFLLNYRVTPNPNAPDGKSPAEALMGRRLRTTLDLMTPKRPPIHHTNSLMETHYNKRHGARHRNFRIGDAVFAAFHQGRQISWIPGQVVGRRGKVMYDVRVGRQLWVRHANQLRPRITRIQEARHSEGFAFNELLYPSQPSTSIRQDTQPMERAENEKQLRPTRRRRCVQPMQVDPRRKTYTNTGSTISTRGRC
ncbi:unnamed protein product [Dicrocoelium dendriticum]|nr:unnamed protein product [Dicrocoelium dendriticum]